MPIVYRQPLSSEQSRCHAFLHGKMKQKALSNQCCCSVPLQGQLQCCSKLSLLLDSFNLRSHSNLSERFGFFLAPPHGTGLAPFFF